MSTHSTTRRTIKFAALCTAFAIVGTAGGVASAGESEKKANAKVLLEESWKDDSNGWSGGDETYSVAVDGGQLVMRNEKNQFPPWSFADTLLPKNDSLRNQRVEVDATLDEGGAIPAAMCLLEADVDAPDYSSYTFGVWPDTGLGYIWQTSVEGKNERLFKTKKPVVDPDTTELHLGGDCIQTDDGVKLTLRVNGKRVLSGVDTEDPITRTGVPGVTVFGMAADSFPVQVSFDNFKAYQLK